MAEKVIDLILRGGKLVLPSGNVTADLAIRNGVIVGIGRSDAMPKPRRVIDVSGAEVVPGAIDVHVHFNTFSVHLDTLGRASQSAAYGGITSFLGFLMLPAEASVEESIDHFVEEGKRDSVIDFGLHLILRPQETMLEDIDVALARGITSFKMFMAYARRGLMVDDGLFLHALHHLASAGGLAMVHAENGLLIDWLEDASIAAGRKSPVDYPFTRPPLAEAEAIHRATRFAHASGCPLYVVHVSSTAGLLEIKNAKMQGYRIYAETCPQYLLLSDSIMLNVGPLGKIAPPLRKLEDNEALWNGLRTGHLDIVASDHGSYSKEMKAVGADDIFRAPFGAPGTETLLPLLYSEGVLRRGLPLRWLARVLSETPSKLFGLYPRKGVIAVGSDADLVVLDPSGTGTIRAASMHTASDYTLFEGFGLQGRLVLSMARGHVLLAEGRLQVDAGHGQYLKREPYR